MVAELPSLQDTDAENKEEENTSTLLEEALGQLSTKSTLDMFRMFFDIKPACWPDFQNKFIKHSHDKYPWGIIQSDEKVRRECAEAFLEAFGNEYWGTPEGREKHLVEERVRNGDSCVYPAHKKPLTEGLMKLLEKKAKGKRESGAQNASSSRQDAGQSSDTTTAEPETTPVVSSTSRETPTASPAIKPDSSPETIRPVSRVQDRPLLPPFGSIDQVPQSAPRNPSAFGLSGFRSQPLALAYETDVSSTSSQRATHAQLQLATFFMIRCTDNDGQPQHVCVPFEMFQNADRFLDRMAEKMAEFDPVWRQISRDMPQLQRRHATSAVVYLRWSGVSFVIRRGTDDLQALIDRVGCAWTAKNQGALRTFEFEIEVSLKME